MLSSYFICKEENTLKIKNFLISTTASILAFSSIIGTSFLNEKVVNAADENQPLYEQVLYEGFVDKSVTTGYELNIDNYPCSRGVHDEKIKITFTGNYNKTSKGMAVTVAAVLPNLSTGENVTVGGQVIYTTPNEYGIEVSSEVSISDILAAAKHKNTTGVKGTPATEDVHKFVIYTGNYALNNNVKIEVLTPFESEPTTLTCEVKYQQKIESPNDIRFIGIADAEQIEAATSAKAALSVAGYDDPDNFVAVEGSPETITKAYKSIVANGQKIEADEGKCFLVTSPINVPDGNKAKAVFSIDGLAGESERTVVIGNAPESSSEEESSSEPDSSSEVEDSSSEAEGTEVIWTGSAKTSWSSEVELTDAKVIENAKAGGILTVYYDSTSSTQIQIINKIGEDWTWTEMLSADGNNYFDAVGGKLQIKLTAEQAQQLVESRAMYLKGSGATVTKITYTSPEAFAGTTETIWEGSESLGSWNKDVDIKAAGIPLAEEGGIVTVYYESTGSAQISVINKVGSSWKWTPLISPEGNEYYDTSGGKLQIKLTAEQAEQFATSKAIFFKGQNATITKLTYTAPGGSEGIREVLWTGSEDLGSWDKDVDLKVAGYSLAEAGGVLTIKYESKGAAQISVINKVGTGWVWTPMVSSEGNEYFDTTGGTLEITLTAEQAEQLATSKAMFLKGQNAVVTEIIYTYK